MNKQKYLMEKCSLQLNKDQIGIFLQRFYIVRKWKYGEKKKFYCNINFIRTTFWHSFENDSYVLKSLKSLIQKYLEKYSYNRWCRVLSRLQFSFTINKEGYNGYCFRLPASANTWKTPEQTSLYHLSKIKYSL